VIKSHRNHLSGEDDGREDVQRLATALLVALTTANFAAFDAMFLEIRRPQVRPTSRA
jgi:hypothetical protein